MNENTEFPITFQEYSKQHPEKFEERVNTTKKTIYGAITVFCLLIVFFPSMLSRLPLLSYFPNWVFIAAGAVGALYCLVMFLGDCDGLYNIQSNGVIEQVGLKKFDRANTKPDELIAALERRDFEFLASAAYTDNDPFQLFVFEDALGKEFYLHLRAYTAPAEFYGASDVVTVSGRDYDLFRSTIKSMGPMK